MYHTILQLKDLSCFLLVFSSNFLATPAMTNTVKYKIYKYGSYRVAVVTIITAVTAALLVSLWGLR